MPLVLFNLWCLTLKLSLQCHIYINSNVLELQVLVGYCTEYMIEYLNSLTNNRSSISTTSKITCPHKQ